MCTLYKQESKQLDLGPQLWYTRIKGKNMPIPSHLNKEVSPKTKANKQEDRLHKHLCSGALSWKGDFSTSDTLIESKSTDKLSFKITKDVLDKLKEQAGEMGKENSVLIIELPKLGYRIVCKVENM